MKQILMILIGVLLLTVSVYGSVINGRVVSAEDQTPLAGANIMIAGTTMGAAADQNGFFTIDGVTEGTYSLKASFIGYNSMSRKITIGKGGSQSVQFKLSESVFNMDAIVVTATRTEKALKDVPALTEVITRRQLEMTGAVVVQDALNELPALDFAPNQHGANISMHGLDQKYVLILIDGERIAGETKGNIDFSRLNTSDIERIEIVKGASSSLYGSNAIAGVINIITRKVKKPLAIELHSQISKHNTLGIGGSAGFKYGWLTSKTLAMYKRSDGYDLHPQSIAQTVEEYNDVSINQKFKLHPSENLTIDAGGGYYFYRKLEARRKMRNKYPRYYDFNYHLGIHYQVSQKLNLEMKWHSDSYESKEVMMLLDGEERRTYQNTNQTARLLAHYLVNDNHTFTSGIEFQNEKVFSTRITGETHQAQNHVLFMQDEIEWGQQWKFVPGFRLNNHSEYGTHFTPSLSVMYQVLPINLRASYARGFKSPTLKELYYNWDHGGGGPYVYGNPDLQPETSDYMSISAEYIANRLNSSISLFHTDLKNMIDSRPEPGDPNVNYYGNVARAMTQGIEWLLKLDMGKGMAVSGGYSLIDSEDKTTGKPLYGRARHTGTVKLEYRHSRFGFTANLRAKFISSKLWGEEIDETTNELIKYEQSPYAIWRFTATKTLFSFVKFTAGVDNIFDYRDIDYLITPGRVVYGGFNISYK